MQKEKFKNRSAECASSRMIPCAGLNAVPGWGVKKIGLRSVIRG
jgi:hypothetical protein